MRKPLRITLTLIAIASIFALAKLFATPFDELFTTSGPAAQAIFIILVITEVIIAPIPGGVLSLLGAAHFGFLRGWALTYLGNVIGTSAVFLIARHIGRPYVEKAVSKRQRKPYEHLMREYPKTFWLAYTIPILPVDILSILLGLTDTKYRRFLLITATGLLTYTGIWAYIGAYYAIHIPYLEYISTAALLLILAGITYWAYKEFGPHINWKKLTRR